MTIAGFLLPETAATELLVGPMIAGILIGAAPFGGLHDNLPTAPVVLIAAIANAAIWSALCGGLWAFVMAVHRIPTDPDDSANRPPNVR